ncbi:hypothetical protein [Caldilinea sp.]|uniref:hypothetical protein n=1 Tax=Caldilinea sp. TaxID=2293560 RepID=UPI0021DF04BE|nr:hypothetical protein [Caldilinea sp.]GIV73538.1 MAG: hypothetical protein KatS3mg049_2094 [Caldilinea sp.]
MEKRRVGKRPVRVRYTGRAHRRIVDGYEWNAANGYVLEVADPALVERLLANGDFVVEDAMEEAQEAREDRE